MCFVKHLDLLLDRRYNNVLLIIIISEMTSPLHSKVVSIAGALSSAEASLCCREAGKKETEGARGIVHRALFIFLLLLFLLGYPPGGDATPSGFIYYTSRCS